MRTVYSVLFGIRNLMISPHSGGSQVGLIRARFDSTSDRHCRPLRTDSDSFWPLPASSKGAYKPEKKYTCKGLVCLTSVSVDVQGM